MELLKLSKFKLQLRSLISEVHQLKERERFANERLQLMIQKQQQTEEDFSRKITNLQAELDLANELRQKLERKVSCLETENDLLEDRQKSLKETISNLLQSRESFDKVYEDSFGEMKQAIEARDRKIKVLSEKIKSHLLLVEAIEKEANSIKQVVDNAECAVKEREDEVVGLKRKLDKISELEEVFVDKINNLESKLRNGEDELKRKDKVILCLEAQLETAKCTNDFQPRVDELQRALSAKELLVQNLILEKKALHFEVGNLSFAMKKVQDAVSHMDEEDRKAFSSVVEGQEKRETVREIEVNSFRDVQRSEDDSHQNDSSEEAVENAASTQCQKFVLIPLEENNIRSCVSEGQAACSSTQSSCLQPQSADTVSSSLKQMCE